MGHPVHKYICLARSDLSQITTANGPGDRCYIDPQQKCHRHALNPVVSIRYLDGFEAASVILS